MSGQPTKPGNYGGDMIIITKKRGSCGACQHFCADGSCAIHPVVLREVGTDYWRTCHDYTPRSISEASNSHHPISATEARAHEKECAESEPTRRVNLPPCADSRLISGKRICTKRYAPFYGRTCYTCSYHRMPPPPIRKRTSKSTARSKVSWKETERQALKNLKRVQAAIDKENNQSEDQARKNLNNNEQATKAACKQQSPQTVVKSPTINQQNIPAARKKKVSIPEPKAGCIYLQDNICIAKGTPCAHGNQHCLFYKKK